MKEILFYREGKADYPSFFSDKLICKWIEVIAGHYNKYLKHDYYTDVITFDYCEGDVLSGDVFISLDTVKSNSEMFSTFFENEFCRVICHSVLHLIGFKDKTDVDSKEMRKNENICLDLLKTL